MKKEYALLYIKGLFMGTADLIPGVSGGTIAFITGIYEELVQTISSLLNYRVFKSLIQFRIKEVLEQINGRFLAPLLCGILSAIALLAHFMHYLLLHHPVPTWAAFFGLIGGSIFVMGKELDRPLKWSNFLWIGIGVVCALIVVSLIPVETPEAWWFLFLCGMISMMAMILPGISGSFLLLILGKYQFVTGALRNPLALENMATICVFACGGVLGLLSFSKGLNYLLKHYHSLTMAFLLGILIGSMKKIWPWKAVLESKIVQGKVKVLREANIMPGAIDGEVVGAIVLILLGFTTVLFVGHRSSPSSRQKNLVS